MGFAPMCGIAGVIGGRDSDGAIRRMTAALRHRGPDGAGHFTRGACSVGATRLSIVDLDAGSQPIFNETGSTCVVFNGELYNHRELRRDLRARGHVFRTETDTEVIVHLYEEMGDDLVRNLDGMFAFAILDGARVLLARDPLGIKPLYICHLRGVGQFLFASEIKALLSHPGLTPTLNIQALADAMAIGHVVGDQTYFDGITTLEPGHLMVVSVEGAAPIVESPRPYKVTRSGRDADMTLLEAEDRLAAALDAAVSTHLSADVDVGLTLSGGLDSSLLGLFACGQVDHPLLTFSIADHKEHADLQQARAIAGLIGSEHQSIVIPYDDYVAAIPELVVAEEQPSSLFGLPFLLLSRAVAERVRVSLHGEGADELFGGYSFYLDPDARLSRIRERLPRLKHLGVAPSNAAIDIMQRLCPNESFEESLAQMLDVELRGPLERQHLTPVDKCSMAASVEMRVPYLDTAVVDVARTIPLAFIVRPELHIRKYVLRTMALRRFGPDVADAVLRSKFGAPASGLMHLDRFNRVCEEMLPDEYVDRHAFGGCFTSKRELLMFDMFLDIFMKHRGDGAAVGNVFDYVKERGQTLVSTNR